MQLLPDTGHGRAGLLLSVSRDNPALLAATALTDAFWLAVTFPDAELVWSVEAPEKYVWKPCSKCGWSAVVARAKSKQPGCRATPGCKGKHKGEGAK